MNLLVQSANQILSLLTILGQAMAVFLFFLLITKNHRLNALNRFSLPFAFLVAFLATAGSLFYSEIGGFEPCKLCWFQRIFMYPQVVLLGLALWKKDKNIVDYNLTLAFTGAVFAAYHYFLQMKLIKETIFSCSTTSVAQNCSLPFFVEFGYVTMPLMALTAFVLVMLSLAVLKRNQS